ncbi:MAG TPA: hypothetical protein VNX17_01440 [Edaphobacter sp.]|nr:hypothetical protein [Edaphobacter sp.]
MTPAEPTAAETLATMAQDLSLSELFVLSVNDLHVVSTAVVEAARDSLVIGPG